MWDVEAQSLGPIPEIGSRVGMYQNDSFFTLNTGGQIGLAVLSAVLALGMLLLTRRLAITRTPARRVAVWALLYFLFVWLSPQLYYTYYRAIIPGLPSQWVIPWPDVLEPLALLTFTAGDSLSAHGRGILGWAMLVMALWRVRTTKD